MLKPKVPTSLETPKSLANFVEAGLNPEAPQDTVKSTKIMELTTTHFFHVGQFLGLWFGGSDSVLVFECS